MRGKLIKEVIDFKIKPKTLGLYKIYCERFPHIYYVGSSRDMRRRLNDHARKLESGKHKNYKLKRLYGMFPNEFRFEIIEAYEVHDQELDNIIRKREEAQINFPPEGVKLLNLDKRTYKYKRKGG